MKTAACLAAILGSAAAFAPAQEAKQTTALAAFENEREFSPNLVCLRHSTCSEDGLHGAGT